MTGKRNKPSRFLEEIEPELVQHEESAAAARMRAARETYMQRQNGYLDRTYNRAPAGQGGYGSYGGYQGTGGGYASRTAAGARKSSTATPRPIGGASSIQAGSAVRADRPATGGDARYQPGDVVEHKVFGRGTVLKVTPVGGDHIVEIRFDTAGVKKTMANYAPLKRVDK